jgi:lactate racemase
MKKMEVKFRYGKEEIELEFPDMSQVFRSGYIKTSVSASEMLLKSVSEPDGCLPLMNLLKKRRAGDVVIVVSDITRPIPYRRFLPELIGYIASAGIKNDEIMLLIATGMHRPSTWEEKLYMFGKELVENFRIVDHIAEDEEELTRIEGKSWSGSDVLLNRNYVRAGFRIITGLVEPHFMAGFSGGRKSICPGLVALKTVQKFHGYQFLNNPLASNGILDGNPLHLEAESIARLCPSDFSIHIVLDQNRDINAIISGDQFASHQKATKYVKERSFVGVRAPVDVAVTSCGGYPLDDTFYQCVKGFVNCIPAVKKNGEIIAFGKCEEGIGSPEYEFIMKKYASRTDDFLRDIENDVFYIKDQWQFQMHLRAIKKTGLENLHFFTSGLDEQTLGMLSVHPHAVPGDEIAASVQDHIDRAVRSGKQIAVFPEGPYCSALIM